MVKIPLIILTFYSLLSSQLHAKPSKTKSAVEIEWGAVPEASFYELEFRNSLNKIYKVKTKNNFVKDSFSCGRYSFKARTINVRNVIGTWGAEQSFEVFLRHPVYNLPELNKKVLSYKKVGATVDFEWDSVGTNVTYTVFVYDEAKKVVATAKTKETYAALKLPVEKQYSWKVFAVKPGCESNPSSIPESKFELYGDLDTPKLVKTDTSIKWAVPNGTENFDILLEKEGENSKGEKKWNLVRVLKRSKNTTSFITRDYNIGHYRFSVVALGKRRQSRVAVMDFYYNQATKLSSRIDLAVGFMPITKTTNIESTGLSTSIQSTILENYSLSLGTVYKNIGVFLDYEKGSKTLLYRNPVNLRLKTLNFQNDRLGLGVGYDYFWVVFGISTKISYVREKLNSLKFLGPFIFGEMLDTNILEVQTGPVYLWGPNQIGLYLDYDHPLSSKPYKVSPYSQYAYGVSYERFINDNMTIGTLLQFGSLKYSYADNENNNFTNSSSYKKFGLYLKMTFY